MNEFTVDANFESTSAGGDQFHRLDPSDVANFGRQTGGPGLVVSNHAVFDRDVSFHVVLLAIDPMLSRKSGSSRRVF